MPWLGQEEISSLEATILRSWLTEGPECKVAAEKLEKLLDCKYVTFAPNCSLGLFIGLLALDLPKFSEVLVPDFTFFASLSTIAMAGLKPVVVDVNKDTFQMDLDDLKNKISINTSAIMPVHIYGQGSNIQEIISLAEQKKLKVIEDAAQVLGVKYEHHEKNNITKKHLGTFGDLGVFSLYADKTITTGEGGIICTNNENLFNKIKALRNYGRPNSGTFIHQDMGMNFRITDMQGALLNAQLEKLDDIKEQRNKTYSIYKEEFAKFDFKTMQIDNRSDFVPFRFPVLVKDPKPIIDELDRASIQTRRFFYPMHRQPALEKYNLSSCANSNYLYEHGICLPIHREITKENIRKMINIFKKYI